MTRWATETVLCLHVVTYLCRSISLFLAAVPPMYVLALWVPASLPSTMTEKVDGNHHLLRAMLASLVEAISSPLRAEVEQLLSWVITTYISPAIYVHVCIGHSS